jgi:predicted porin
VKKNMNTKLIAALVIVGVLAVTIVGLVSAQIATSNPNGTTANGSTSDGFLGWMGRCLGFRGAPYYGTGTSAVPQAPLNITVTDPNTNTTTTFQSYGNGYGYGGCMRGFFP